MRSPLQQPMKLPPEIARRSRVAIITAQFNAAFTKNLERHCVRALKTAGVPAKQVTSFAVPGSLEIPVVAKRLALSERYQVIIALGVVLKGETYHFELVAENAARGCTQVAVETGVPVIMEILACYTRAQAQARCGNNVHNKGREAAAAAIAMLRLLPKLGEKQT